MNKFHYTFKNKFHLYSAAEIRGDKHNVCASEAIGGGTRSGKWGAESREKSTVSRNKQKKKVKTEWGLDRFDWVTAKSMEKETHSRYLS